MAPAEIIRQEDSGRGVSPATGDGTEQGPNEDQNEVPPSPGTEAQGPNEDDVEQTASTDSETQPPNDDETFEEDAEPGFDEDGPESSPKARTHAEADQQAAELEVTFPDEVTTVEQKVEFLETTKQERAAESGDPA